MALFGVDIHASYQAGISLPKLKAEGYTFVVDKASEGTGIPPLNGSSAAFKAQTLAWVAEARALGMVPGLYHWLKAGNAAGQARFFYGIVTQAGGPAGMLIQLDCEDNATYADVQAWDAEWERLTGGHPYLLYTGKWWWGPRGWDGKAITPYLWHSHYLSADDDTISDDPAAFAARVPGSWWTPGYGGWPSATILQFTSRGDAGTLGNNVDLNVFRGSLEELAVLLGGGNVLTSDNDAQHEIWRVHAMAEMHETIQGGPQEGREVPIVIAINKIAGEVAALKSGGVPPADLKAVLLDPDVLAAIAKAVTDEIGS
jgi:glycosyl hydrolase family 25